MRPLDCRPLVSVVIACRDGGRVLAGAAGSAVARAARVQIIVVDDGSADDTAAVARTLDVVLIRQPQRGAAAARNRGLQAAAGEFIVFLDPDDRLLDGAIDIGVRALTSKPACAMAYGRGVTIGSERAAMRTAEVTMVRAGHYAALLQTNLIWMSAMAIFRRAAVERAGGFAEGIDAAVDYDLYLRLSRQAPVLDHGLRVAARGRDPDEAHGDAERALRDTLAVMRRNCPKPHSAMHGAWREGYARWQDVHGTRLADEIRRHLAAHELAEATRKGVTLASLAPRVFVRELGRAGRLVEPRRHRIAKSTIGSSPSSNAASSAIPNSVSRS